MNYLDFTEPQKIQPGEDSEDGFRPLSYQYGIGSFHHRLTRSSSSDETGYGKYKEIGF